MCATCMYEDACGPAAQLPAALPSAYTADLAGLCSTVGSVSEDRTQIRTSGCIFLPFYSSLLFLFLFFLIKYMNTVKATHLLLA